MEYGIFGRIINSIIRTGSTGVVVENSEIEDSEVEKIFIKSIKEKIIEHSTENSLSYIKTAFDYAQLSYLTYKFYYSSDDLPSAVEQFPLGIYELLLETFNYVRTPPTIVSQGQLVEQNDLEFEIEILPTLTPEEETKLSDAEVKNAQAMRKSSVILLPAGGNSIKVLKLNKVPVPVRIAVQMKTTEGSKTPPCRIYRDGYYQSQINPSPPG